MNNLPQQLKGKVAANYLNGLHKPQMFTVVLKKDSIDAEKDIVKIVEEIEFALNIQGYDEAGLQIFTSYEGLGRDILQILEDRRYEIEFLGQSKCSIGYRIRKQKKAIPQQSSTSPANKGRKAVEQGLLVQRQVTEQYRQINPIITCSTQRRKADIIAHDHNKNPVEIVAIKSYSLEITTGSGCRNVKGHKYVVSFTARRDAKAECKAAQKYGLNQIRLIVVNLRTGRKIFDGLVGFDDAITLREYR